MAYPSSVHEAYKAELQGIRDKGIYKEERYIHSPQAAGISVEFPSGQPAKRVVNLCSNNYLGLSSHPDVVAAAHRGLDERGYGMSSVRFICGTQDLHRELEHKLTEFLGTEDTILFPSCMDANGGVFEAVLNDQDVMIADRLVHASIVDGMRLCKAMQDTYKHADMKHLEQKLQEHQDKRVRLIITDGVFSMDGDLAPLDEIVALAEKYDAMVFVDDSHASGFMGKTGRGVHEHFNVVGKIDIITTTLGKALGGASGGCVSGRKEIVELCRQKIPLLVRYFLERFCRELMPPRPVMTVSQGAMRRLMAHSWPGNVRQLENALERAVALGAGRPEIDVSDLPPDLQESGDVAPSGPLALPDGGLDFQEFVSNVERELIRQSLERTGGNKGRAAELLHLKRTTLVEKLKRMNQN